MPVSHVNMFLLNPRDFSFQKKRGLANIVAVRLKYVALDVKLAACSRGKRYGIARSCIQFEDSVVFFQYYGGVIDVVQVPVYLYLKHLNSENIQHVLHYVMRQGPRAYRPFQTAHYGICLVCCHVKADLIAFASQMDGGRIYAHLGLDKAFSRDEA